MPNPDVIAELAGTRLAIEASTQIERGEDTGLGSAREQHQRRIPSQEVRELEAGECFVSRRGRAARVQVAYTDVPEAPRGDDRPPRRPARARKLGPALTPAPEDPPAAKPLQREKPAEPLRP